MSKIFNKKNYAAGIVCCVAVAAIYTGLSYEKPKVAVNPPKNSVESQELQNQPVVANKNATSTGSNTKDTELKALNVKENEVVAKEIESQVAEPSGQTTASEHSEAVETIADNGTGLIWPVAGEIVMDYSTGTGIYDVTLNQYRTNDFISIRAEVGENVKESGSGTVEFVGEDSERGNMVVINHNNGWKTTYCQLQDGVSVEEGQSISKGQSIGKVSDSTIYSTMLGSHLDFKVTNTDEPVDPKVALAN